MNFNYLNLFNYLLIILILFLNKIKLNSFAFLTEPKLVYVDGIQPWDNCRPGLKRSLISLTGLILSHSFYGSLPYNSSRNCFLTIAVPIGYRVRLKALDFDVQGQWGNCEREDTLHIFDHNQQLEPETLELNEQIPISGHSPGKLLGEFCGKIKNKKNDISSSSSFDQNLILAESTQNALTLWWHTEDDLNNNNKNIQHQQQKTTIGTIKTINNNLINSRINAQGFRLLWSSFRYTNSSSEKCRSITLIGENKKEQNNSSFDEFKCKRILNNKQEECIPIQLGCNSYSDCSDESDLDLQIQLKHGCEHIPNIPLSVLISSGPKRLLLCIALLLVWLSLCLGCCCCYVSYRRKRIKKKRSLSLNNNNNKDFNNIITTNSNKQQLNNYDKNNLFYPINKQQQNGNNNLIPSSHPPPPPPPILPPPSFSPPTLRNTNRLPPQTNFIINKENIYNLKQNNNNQELKKQKRTKQQNQSNSCSSNSQSSSSQQQQQKYLNKQNLNNPPSISSFEKQQQQNYLEKTFGNNFDCNDYLYLKEPMTPLVIRGGKQQTINNEGNNRHLIL